MTSVRVPQFTPPLNRKEILSSATSSSTMTRKEKDAERKRRQRASETPEERETRNEKDRLYARRKRSSESSDASLERLRKQQMINETRRSNETAEQHRSRLDQQQVIDITRRNKETTDERTARIISDSQRRRRRRTMVKRNNPHEVPWPTPISQRIKENCLSEFNKKMSMNSLREQVCIVCNSRHNEITMHMMLLSDINENLLKPHQSLHETIFDIPPAHSQDVDFDRESISLNESSKSQ